MAATNASHQTVGVRVFSKTDRLLNPFFGFFEAGPSTAVVSSVLCSSTGHVVRAAPWRGLPDLLRQRAGQLLDGPAPCTLSEQGVGRCSSPAAPEAGVVVGVPTTPSGRPTLNAAALVPGVVAAVLLLVARRPAPVDGAAGEKIPFVPLFGATRFGCRRKAKHGHLNIVI